jgi:hypothetical protein
MGQVDGSHAPLTKFSLQAVTIIDDFIDHMSLHRMKNIIAFHPPAYRFEIGIIRLN